MASSDRIAYTPVEGMNSGGVDPSAAKFTLVENAVFSRKEVASKRNGTTTVTTQPGSNLTDLASLNGLLVTTGDGLSSYTSAGVGGVVSASLPTADITRRRMVSPVRMSNSLGLDPSAADTASLFERMNAQVCGHAEGANYSVIVYSDTTEAGGSSSDYITYNKSTYAVIETGSLSLPGARLCVGTDGAVYAFCLNYLLGNPSSLLIKSFGSTGNRGSLITIALAEASVEIMRWSVVATGGSSNSFLIAYATATDVAVVSYHATGSTISETTFGRAAESAVFAWRKASGLGVVAISEATRVYAKGYTETVAASGLEVDICASDDSTLYITGAALSSTASRILVHRIADSATYEVNKVDSYDLYTPSGLEQMTVTASKTAILSGCSVVTAPMASSATEILVLAVPQHWSTQPGVVCYRLSASASTPIATSMIGYGHRDTLPFARPQVVSGGWKMAVIEAVPATGNIARFGVDEVFVSISAKERRCLDAGGVLLLPGSLPLVFDGTRVFEQGFLNDPKIYGITQAGAGTIGAGTYSVAIVMEYSDVAGRRWLSAPSEYVAFTADGAHEAVITAYKYQNSLMDAAKIRYLVYITAKNGSLMYLAGQMIPHATALDMMTYSIGDALWVWGVNGEGLADWNARPDPTKNERIYTESGDLGVSQPQGHWVSCLHQGRHVVAPTDYLDSSVFLSKSPMPGQGVEHSDVLQIQIDRSAGRVTGLASLNDRLIIFCQGSIWMVAGDGPNNAGAGVQFSAPICISASKGLPIGGSLSVFPGGVIFHDGDDIVLLDKLLQAQSIGEPVKYWTQAYGVVATECHAKIDSVLFSLGSAQGTLCYNYLYGQWSKWTLATNRLKSIGSTLYIMTTGQVLLNSTTGYTDKLTVAGAAAGYGMKIETGWIKPGGPGGIARIRRALIMGHAPSGRTLTIKAAYDRDPVWQDSQTLAVTDAHGFPYSSELGAGLASTYQDQAAIGEVAFSRQKLESIRLQIVDSAWPTSGGALIGSAEGWDLEGIALIVAPKPGPFRLGSGRKAS
jgi:hypothetical protein